MPKSDVDVALVSSAMCVTAHGRRKKTAEMECRTLCDLFKKFIKLLFG